MPFQIIRNDITKVRVDAIVNTANPDPVIGNGTDSAVYAAAGEDGLLAARKKIGKIEPGNAVYTDAFDLAAKYVIHTVGPEWDDGHHGEVDILRSCYEKSLAIADGLNCRSIAFPLISTGVYGFPKDLALETALEAIGKFLLTHEMNVILVVFDRKSFELSSSVLNGIEEFISESDVELVCNLEYPFGKSDRCFCFDDRVEPLGDEYGKDGSVSYPAENGIAIPRPSFPDVSGKSLDDVICSADGSFKDRLFELIDASGMDDIAVYKKANIDRKVFSRIKCKKDYKPKKRTAVAFAFALELDLQTMLDLLARAGIAFSPSNKFDLIVAYFVTNRNYNIFEINTVLFKYGQPLLGY